MLDAMKVPRQHIWVFSFHLGEVPRRRPYIWDAQEFCPLFQLGKAVLGSAICRKEMGQSRSVMAVWVNLSEGEVCHPLARRWHNHGCRDAVLWVEPAAQSAISGVKPSVPVSNFLSPFETSSAADDDISA
jgi:hypothetical protein